jgi:predicted SnoaL-like aldol condensation-catalyzing enzyme
MIISHTRRLAIALVITAVIGMAASTSIAGASQPPHEATDAAHLTPSGQVFELFSAVFNGGDAAAAERLIGDDTVLHTPYGDYVGPEGVVEYVAFVKRTYPDATFRVTDVRSSGNTVAVDWTMTASRFQVDPVEQPITVEVTLSGEMVLAVTDRGIVGMTQINETLAIVTPVEVAVAPGHMQWP